jgi:GT2 family glycosyltransferase
MKVSVVILNWNGLALLKKYLDKVILFSQGGSFEVVVADNGSDDGSLDYLNKNYFGKIRVIDLKINHGFAEGYNLALSELDSEYVVLLNSDVEVTEGWLDSLVAYMDNNSDVAACQPKIRSILKREFFEHAGAAGGYIDFLGYPFCRGRILDVVEEDNGQFDNTVDIFWATGACLCIRLKEFIESGGLDARFFAHMEEIDLCWRLKSRGKRIVCVHDSCVYHLGGATLSKENPRKTYLNYRNNLLMLYKNINEDDYSIVFFLRFILDYLSFIVFVLSGKFKDAKAVLNARNDFRKMKKDFLNQRNENLSKTVVKKIPEIFRGSIIAGSYLFNKKYYNQYNKD